MPGAGKPKKPTGAVGNPPGSLFDGHMAAENVSGLVRIDMYQEKLNSASPLNERFCRVMDLRTARSFAILLIDAIDQAETEAQQREKK